MTVEVACPVCGREHIPEDRDSCPQCDADLTCFKALDALPEPAGDAASRAIPVARPSTAKTRAGRFFLFGALACILVGVAAILLVIQFHRISDLESGLSEQRSVLTDALGRIESRLVRISVNQEKSLTSIATRVKGISDRLSREEKAMTRTAADPPGRPDRVETHGESAEEDDHPPAPEFGPQKKVADAAQKTETSGKTPRKRFHPPASDPETKAPTDAVHGDAFEFYQAGNDDLLWWIADRFYGSGFYYPVILEHNPHLNIYNIGKKDRIAILKDIDRVKKLYREITEIDEKRLFWRYTVRPGDTLSSIRKRYCPSSRDCIRASPDFDPEKDLQPGDQLWIQLAGASK